ncbi:MAG: ABC transporter permease subunit [Sporichthyaceae bacterium]
MQLQLWQPVLVMGVVQAGLYGLLPISLVLCYRVGRSIAFVHGGIATAAAMGYWALTYNENLVPGRHPAWPPVLGLAVIVAAGAAVAAGYGALAMSPRFVGQSRMTHTVMSLAAMLLLFGIFTSTLHVPPFVYPPSPVGRGSFEFGGAVVTDLRFAVLCTTTVLVASLAAFLARTRAGRHIRAIADDLQAAQWNGVAVARIGTGVYAVSGAISALAGVAIASSIGADPGALLQFLLRGLAVAVVGAMVSLPLALLGAALVSLTETALTAGMFGTVSLGIQELWVNAVLLTAVMLVLRRRGTEFYLLTRQAL